MRKILLFICFFTFNLVYSQITIAPASCYPEFADVAAMDAAAVLPNSITPFGTWKAAYDHAVANGITTIDFAEAVYYPGGLSGLSSDWGDAFGGFELPAGMTVNGNGAVIDNSANDNALAFATIAGNNATIDGFTFIEFTGNNAGAVVVVAGLTGWTISNCNFDNCDWAGDALVVNQGASSSGTISGCNFYNNVQSTGSAMTVNGPGGNLDIINTVYSCNSRIVAGGAVRILGNANVNYIGCVFDGNETNSANGGAISIEGISTVDFLNTNFTCNTAVVNNEDVGGAMSIIGGSNVSITGCNFIGNEAALQGGAISANGTSSAVTVDINNSTFDGNFAVTAGETKGGALYLNDANVTLDGSYFTNNDVNDLGGAIYISIGNNNTTYNFNSNTFTTNDASGACTGIDIFTEMHISGDNNKLDHLADGHFMSNGAGSLEYANGDDCDALSNWSTNNNFCSSGGRLVVSCNGAGTYDISQTETFDVTEKMYWTINMGTSRGIDNDHWLVFALASDNADLTAPGTSGYALALKRANSGSSGARGLQFIEFTDGLNDVYSSTTNLLQLHTYGSSSSGSVSLKIVYNAGTWTFYLYGATDSEEQMDVDTRGYNYCSDVFQVSSILTLSGHTISNTDNNVGGVIKTDDSSSPTGAFNNYYFRVGDESQGTGGVGSGTTATCSTCLVTTIPANDCSDNGSIQGVVFNDEDDQSGDDDGVPISGATVNLYACDGTLLETVTTDATGAYFFGGLTYGDCYYVEFTLPSGFNFATVPNYDPTDPIGDSDIDGTTFQSAQITICSTCAATTEDNLDGTSGSAHYTDVDAGFTVTQPSVPVILSSFTVVSNQCNIDLNWVTQSEVNNEKFIIELSTDGKYFDSIGEVIGKGNSLERESYFYSFQNSKSSNGLYFRLKQIDFDGAYEYLGTKFIRLSNCEKGESSLLVYPNVFTEEFKVEFLNSTEQVLDLQRIQIFNSNGKLVYSKNFLTNDSSEIKIDGAQWKPGFYYLNAVLNSGSNTLIKLVKI